MSSYMDNSDESYDLRFNAVSSIFSWANNDIDVLFKVLSLFGISKQEFCNNTQKHAETLKMLAGPHSQTLYKAMLARKTNVSVQP